MSNRYIRQQVDTTELSVRPMPVPASSGQSPWTDLFSGLIVGIIVGIAMMKFTALALVLLRMTVRRAYRRQISLV
ncbi:hypothetical protein PG994_001779 [Apiospora phragmitis]|uniref:Uncharacterized protein n=1 Tax=Apiospora phragmitis TaxID=2905665 RepID=A0ABR1WUH1_9PEZI